ncbi:ferritin-like domain-containing protein [Parvibaculum sp.]|jgi:rubrerythrin|uniref:ferritin-like domain-containing protein n=1 Tax=Parvibaculum sp. TaxID=2024848 RepID=UPI000C48834B|nr:ferritin-like domain-containing protein [Parvibaculum sp.]MAM96082.1 rubrerythrin family protein [Parvibaculum sp.]HCX67901.1 rubrerythrin family protein [Rhodobiaceae bacterium]|tara:strand:+ start:3834 stop:4658 length:825 start_codon:yes stop_codon:yes gene_type:complete
MSGHWTLEDIRWQDFDASKVDPDILRAVKAAAMVEFNAPDYVTYLCNVFSDRPEVKETIHKWGEEEVQHGQALARWAELADPAFNFDEAFTRFREGYSIPTDAIESVRGSRGGELIARCVVESGTSSYYTAIKDATDEPVLKQIAANVAADEFRHYKLFYDQFNALGETPPSILDRIRVAVGRVSEADDDELACAYYAANTPGDGSVPYKREIFAKAYEKRALGLYRRQHVERLISMVGKAAGLKPHGLLMRAVASLAWRYWQFRNWQLARAAI